MSFCDLILLDLRDFFSKREAAGGVLGGGVSFVFCFALEAADAEAFECLACVFFCRVRLYAGRLR